MSFEKEGTRRFFEGAKIGLEDLRKSRAKRLGQTPKFFESARQGLQVLRPAVIELDRHLARQFCFFRFIHLDENRMSDVFAYLLDPDETHGQQELFLNEFLSNVTSNSKWVSENSWSGVRINREVRTTRIEDWDRRIDIEIAIHTNDGLVAIAIENRPWAGDQDKQLSDYARHLKLMYEGRFKLIYLTPSGTEPFPNSITCEERKELADKGKFAKASIQDWASDNGWLKRAEDGVKAERVRWFVSDFRKALIESLPEPEEVAE